jgi:predicted RNase H-like nuclease (RuvC/YqgF family)
VRTFTREEPGYPRLRRILRGIEQAAQEGDLSLSKKEERSTSVDWRTLGRLWEEAMQLEAASKRLDETPEKEKAELDLKIRKMEDEKNRLSQSLVDKKREIKKLKRSIARCKTELETELSDLRKGDFSIEMPSIPHTRG